MVAYLAADGAYPIGNTPEQFAQEIRNETARWAKVIKDANIRID
jgi:tripartite-type tricarboxylate transporter receptor subunit TctC